MGYSNVYMYMCTLHSLSMCIWDTEFEFAQTVEQNKTGFDNFTKNNIKPLTF